MGGGGGYLRFHSARKDVLWDTFCTIKTVDDKLNN